MENTPIDQANYTPSQAKKYGYGKRPLWHWILLYLIVGAVAYYLIYYFFMRNGTGSITY